MNCSDCSSSLCCIRSIQGCYCFGTTQAKTRPGAFTSSTPATSSVTRWWAMRSTISQVISLSYRHHHSPAQGTQKMVEQSKPSRDLLPSCRRRDCSTFVFACVGQSYSTEHFRTKVGPRYFWFVLHFSSGSLSLLLLVFRWCVSQQRVRRERGEGVQVDRRGGQTAVGRVTGGVVLLIRSIGVCEGHIGQFASI